MENRPKPNEHITYMLSSIYGFGHTSRASAISELVKHNYGLNFFVKNPNAKEYLLQNLGDETAFKFETADYEKEMSDSEYLVRNSEKLVPLVDDSKFVISDFLMQSKAISHLARFYGNQPKTIGIYHSLTGYDTVDPEIDMFKNTFLNIASELDTVFLAELNPMDKRTEPYKMASGTLVLPTGPVIRQITKTPVEVKQEIGLNNDDEFIYVQGGGLTNGERLDSVVKSLSGCSLQGMKLVINDREGGGVPSGDIIYIKPCPDGHNLVNAASGVIGKPGMGIVSEAVATRTPIFLIDYPTAEARAKYDMLAPLVAGIKYRHNHDTPLTKQIDGWVESWDDMRLSFGQVVCDGARVISDYINTR